MLYNDLDYSFIRLRDNQSDAIDTYSPAVEISYAGYQVHLKPNEAILQITNSPVNINMETYNVYLLDSCGNVLEDITENIFMNAFSDSNGISQIVWEWVNQSDYPGQIVQMYWESTESTDKFWSNYFITSSQDLELTTRFDYTSSGYLDGTQYDYAGFSSQTNENYVQSIRLRMYFNNTVNESERQEYHQISTNVTIAARNIKKWKERYILDSWDDWTMKRLETLVVNDKIYLEGYRTFSSEPIEFTEREMDSDIGEGEAILNKDYSQKYEWVYQEFAGGQAVSFTPTGTWLSGTTFATFTITYNANIELQTGSVIVYNSSDGVEATYTEAVMSATDNVLTITTNLSPSDDTYYVNVSEGLVSFLGLDSEAINDNSTWTFELRASDFLSADYNDSDYLTANS